MKHRAVLVAATLIVGLLTLSPPAGAADAKSDRREGPRIVFGAHGDTTFEFDSLRPMRRSAASSRQAYFGSGELYDDTLQDLQSHFREIEARHRLEGLPLSAAQADAKDQMSPALVRALTLAKKQRAAAAQQ